MGMTMRASDDELERRYETNDDNGYIIRQKSYMHMKFHKNVYQSFKLW